MNFKNELEDEKPDIGEMEEQNSLSIEDFIKELEAKEKDLQISSDLAIEIGDSDFDDRVLPEFSAFEPPPAPVKSLPSPSVTSKEQAALNKANTELKNEVLLLKKQTFKLEGERAEMIEMARRRQIDFDNYKKRIERERGEIFSNQIRNLATQMLPVLDNLNRALDFATSHSESRSQDFQQFYQGIVLVNQQLNEVLSEMGVSPIASVGEYFDPNYHEAVATEVSGEFAPNTITGELLRGYRIGEKVIRAAMVRVSIAGVSPAANQSSIGNDSVLEQKVSETE